MKEVTVTPQNVIIAAKCNTNAKCNNFSTQNVITFLTHNVITQNVIQVGTRSQSTKSEVCIKNAHGMRIQADYWWRWTGATEEGVITEK